MERTIAVVEHGQAKWPCPECGTTVALHLSDGSARHHFGWSVCNVMARASGTAHVEHPVCSRCVQVRTWRRQLQSKFQPTL